MARSTGLITRYLLRHLTVGTVLVTIVLCLLVWLTQSLRFVDLIINQGLSVAGFLKLTVLLLPSFLAIVLPIALFAVILFVYARLTSDRELVVLRAAGLSPLGLARPALILALLVTLANYAVTLHFIPQSVRDFRELQWEVENDLSKVMLKEGAFSQVARGLTVYVRQRTSRDELLGILVHDSRSPEKEVTWMAERGALIHTDNGPRVLMINGNSQELSAGGQRLSLLYFDSYTLDFGLAGPHDEERFRDARERSMKELLATEAGGFLSETDIRRFRVEGHKRLTAPLLTLGFALIALTMLLNGQFSRHGTTPRVLGAITLMVGLQGAQLGAANVAANRLDLLPLLYLSTVLPVLVGFYVLARPPRLKAPVAA
ncbi:LPS export ABC transporter permease LptF [Roseospirillum parvum]|uniref:Lipopolysaccharide export system permease protein n=1 Tax=Roseospirillum parvum TaxID=83401 RepID=A0A1G8ES09_9PROT|nr:LPS export ABC transporter permease LptF [Roseospirillum parvum]SDH72691.1 lipopolysaccharide export system permease protein [Roseospirillum parvum]